METDDPWTRYRTLVDLLDRPETDPEAQATRAEMLIHPQTVMLMAETATWGDRALKRHNDATHPIYALSALADFGVNVGDPGMAAGIDAVMSHISEEGAFQTLVNIPQHFGGTGGDSWSWMSCDAPTLLYALLAMGLGDDVRVARAVEHLASLVDDNGWRCVSAPELGKFRGPGRKADPCPIANVYALKALSLVPELHDSPATRAGAEILLWHWERQAERKIYMFGIGSDFRKLKYPYIWYNILHVAEVLSRFPFVFHDPRFQEMVETITTQTDEEGKYTPGSMYRAWKDWEFANKKTPSPWITFLILRIIYRMELNVNGRSMIPRRAHDSQLHEQPERADERDEEDQQPPAPLAPVAQAFDGDGQRDPDTEKHEHGAGQGKPGPGIRGVGLKAHNLTGDK